MYTDLIRCQRTKGKMFSLGLDKKVKRNAIVQRAVALSGILVERRLTNELLGRDIACHGELREDLVEP